MSRAVRSADNPNQHIEGVWGAGAVWVGSDTATISRANPAEPATISEFDVGGGIPVVFRDNLVWGARADTLWAIDPLGEGLQYQVPLTGLSEILALDVSGNDAWIAARKPGRVGVMRHVAVDSGAVLGGFPVSLPAGVVIAEHRVWVTSYGTDEFIGIPH